ncbi:MAG TPA: phosphotransferase [Ktedonobacterales bacterium]
MTAPLSQDLGTPFTCPHCGRQLNSLVVNPAGELIGCEECAEGMGLAGESLTLAEWNAHELVAEALSHYSLGAAKLSKPAATDSQRPRAHYWEAQTENGKFFVKQFHSWFPPESITYVHSIHDRLLAKGLPAPRAVLNRDGVSFTQSGDSAWAVYHALDGHHANERDWMWGRPKAAEMLGALHQALECFTPDGQPFEPWTAWTIETVDRVLESWQPHPDLLPPDLLGFIRDRLAHRYFGHLYPELPKLVVHGDYVSDNVLWRGDAISSSISGILDLERAHMDTALFDFAWGLGDRRPPLLRAAVASYARSRPLSPVEREALPEAMLLSSLMAIDMQMTYFNDQREVARLATDLHYMVRDLDSLRRAVALRPSTY